MAVRATCIAGTVCISSIARIPGLVKGRVSNFSGTVSRRHRRAAPSRGPGPPPARRRRGEHRECGADPRGRRRDGERAGSPDRRSTRQGPSEISRSIAAKTIRDAAFLQELQEKTAVLKHMLLTHPWKHISIAETAECTSDRKSVV